MTAPQQVFLHGEALSGESETGWTRSPLTSGDNRGEIVHDEDNAEDSGSGSMITTLRVDNLAMVDCVHVEVGATLAQGDTLLRYIRTTPGLFTSLP